MVGRREAIVIIGECVRVVISAALIIVRARHTAQGQDLLLNIRSICHRNPFGRSQMRRIIDRVPGLRPLLAPRLPHGVGALFRHPDPIGKRKCRIAVIAARHQIIAVNIIRAVRPTDLQGLIHGLCQKIGQMMLRIIRLLTIPLPDRRRLRAGRSCKRPADFCVALVLDLRHKPLLSAVVGGRNRDGRLLFATNKSSGLLNDMRNFKIIRNFTVNGILFLHIQRCSGSIRLRSILRGSGTQRCPAERQSCR